MSIAMCMTKGLSFAGLHRWEIRVQLVFEVVSSQSPLFAEIGER